MIGAFTDAQKLKFALLHNGLAIDRSALTALREIDGERGLTPHDYASTSGVILRLDDDVWVNAPIETYNDNFVLRSPYRLSYQEGFHVRGEGLESRAAFWPQPAYHSAEINGRPLNDFVVTHGDRVRLSPIRGCAMTCTFCNVPFDDPLDVYALKPIEKMLSGIRTAVGDPIQPAHHLLISGGTPKPKDVPWLQALYYRILDEMAGLPVDIMMVPMPGLFDLGRLSELGVNELSINIELFNRDKAREWARAKFNQGLDLYLQFIEDSSHHLGVGRVRSMLMVGLEPVADTLAGVRAIAERGGTPVLSPFRPDPATPLRDLKPPTVESMMTVYLESLEIADEFGVTVGPDCPPCTHNTINFALNKAGQVEYCHAAPRLYE